MLLNAGFSLKVEGKNTALVLAPPGNVGTTLRFKNERGLYVLYMSHLFKVAGNSVLSVIRADRHRNTNPSKPKPQGSADGSIPSALPTGHVTRGKLKLAKQQKALDDILSKRKKLQQQVANLALAFQEDAEESITESDYDSDQ